jgi:hypothetical protein
LIPGPDESEEQFYRRVGNSPPLDLPVWEEASATTRTLFGFAIDWVPLTYSTKNLSLWEGGATWIDEKDLPAIQLKPQFQKGSFLGYKRSEVLSHEALHAARMRFDQPKFEEMLAYATSPHRWKRLLGPVFSRRWVFPLLLVSLFAGLFYPYVSCVVMAVVAVALVRVHWQLRRCLTVFPRSVVVCMTDGEIATASKKSKERLMQQWERGPSLRCKLIVCLVSKRVPLAHSARCAQSCSGVGCDRPGEWDCLQEKNSATPCSSQSTEESR